MSFLNYLEVKMSTEEIDKIKDYLIKELQPLTYAEKKNISEKLNPAFLEKQLSLTNKLKKRLLVLTIAWIVLIIPYLILFVLSSWQNLSSHGFLTSIFLFLCILTFAFLGIIDYTNFKKRSLNLYILKMFKD